MWSLVFTGVQELVKSWFETKQAKAKAEQAYLQYQAKAESDWDTMALEAAKHSWKDELITIVWFSPLVVAWFDSERAMEWLAFVSGLPYYYQFIMFGIVASSFGLRWYFKQSNIKDIITKKSK